MFSKRLLLAFLAVFLFLSITALISNMPAKKNKRIYNELLQYFPYKLKKELGGLDIVDTRTGKDLDVANAKVFLAYDELLRKWAKKHLILKNKLLLILDDNGHLLKKIKLNDKEKSWVEEFFRGYLNTQ